MAIDIRGAALPPTSFVEGDAVPVDRSGTLTKITLGKGGAGKVVRIKPSDVKKRKSAREAKEAADKARKLADENDAANAAAHQLRGPVRRRARVQARLHHCGADRTHRAPTVSAGVRAG